MESNNLLTPTYIQGSQDMNRIWSRKLAASDQVWLIGLISYEDEIRIMSIYANDFRQVLLPIREGSTFTENNTSEALTGSNVPTFQSNNKEYINYNGKRYTVIGKLGLSDNSPLKQTVLINDSSLLTNKDDIFLFFDGPGVSRLSWLKGENTDTFGIDRLLFITKLSSYIFWTVSLVCICSNALWIYFFQIERNLVRKISIHSGLNFRHMLKKETYLLSSYYIVISAILLLLPITGKSFSKLMICYFLLWITGLFLNTVILLYYTTKGKMHDIP